MSVLVTNADDHICLNICRSLGKNDVDVGLASDKASAMSFHSKYCKKRHIYMNPSINEAKFVRDIVEIVKNNNYEFLIPTDDITLMAVSSYRDKIEKYINIPIPEHETLEICDNKSKTIKAAEKLGIPCPKTRLVGNVSELDEIAEELRFPVVIKPVRGRGAKGISFLASPKDLKREYNKCVTFHGKTIIQEFIRYKAKYSVAVLLDKDSELKGLCVLRFIREYPVGGGSAVLTESDEEPKLLDYTIKLLKSLNFWGIAETEFVIDSKDNKPRFMEINPRLWGSLSTAIASGVDFPYLLYTMLQEGGMEGCFEYKKGVRSHFLLKDLRHLRTILSGKAPFNYTLTKKQTFINFIKSVNCTPDYVFSVDDPFPAFAELKNIAFRKLSM